MDFIGYNYGQVPSYRSDQGVGSVPEPFRLHESSLQHHSLGGGNRGLGNYSVRTSRMFHVNKLIAKDELGSFNQEAYYDDCRNHVFCINNGDKQLVDSSSKLPKLIQHRTIDNPSVSGEPSFPLYSSRNGRKGAAEDAESLLSNQTVVSKSVECDGNNMVFNAGIKQIVLDEVTPSPEQSSSITICSDGETFESGSTFSKGLLYAVDPARYSESSEVCLLPVHPSIAEHGDLKYSNACNSQQVSEAIPEHSGFISSSLMNAQVLCDTPGKLTSADIVHKGFENLEMDISRALHKNKRNANMSSIHETIQPPPKRPRIQDEFVPENEPSNLTNELEDEPLGNEESSHSGKSSEDPHCNNKELNCVQEKDESHFISMDGQAECEGGVLKEISDNQLGKTSEGKKIVPVSLTYCFTAEQIKEHLLSLNPSMGQHMISGEKESTVETSIGENTCRLCSMDKLLFSPPPIYCAFCYASIKRNSNYYWTLDKKDAKKIFCTGCFKASQGNSIKLQGISFPKSELKREKNDAENEEPWVQCDKCQNWQHQICALYNAIKDPDGKAKYTCPICRLQEMENGEYLTLPATFGAKDLPRTALSDHVEQRLYVKLKAEREARAHKLGESIDKVPEAADLTVRVVSSIDKLLKVNENFRIFLDESYPSKFPYKSKVILLFQKIEGVDVCLFIMFAQEFGQECAQPNQRCIHISYLDSVKYFRPHVETVNGEALRTFVYQEILISYLDYCKKQGFATCYIWACPPQKGEDYIFFCHPETQKSPKPEKLLQWYHLVIRKAMEEGIILGFNNLHDFFFTPSKDCNSKITATRLPYFDGDFWPSKAEEIIAKVENESGGDYERSVKKVLRTRSLREMGHNELNSNAAKDILLMNRLSQAILPVKEQFIIIHMLYTCKRCHEVLPGIHQHSEQSNDLHLCSRCLKVGQNLNQRKTHTSARAEHKKSEIQAIGLPANVVGNDIFETRPYFLHFCQENNYQFGSPRRAKHSSMMILHHLQKQGHLTTTGRTCNICLKDIVELAGWHCDACPKFDVCTTCYHENGEDCHSHKLIQFSPKFECGINKYHARKQQVLNFQAALDVLVHSSRCFQTKSNPCLYPGCSQLKNVFHHATVCKVRANGGCENCKKAWSLLHVHSSQCSDGSCRVPRCLDIKKKIRKECSQKSDRRCSVAGMTDHPMSLSYPHK